VSKTRRASAFAILVAILVSILTITATQTATASEVMPELLWAPKEAVADTLDREGDINMMATDPQGNLTVGCTVPYPDVVQDLTTYSRSGNVSRRIDHTNLVEGEADNCIRYPVVDKTGNVYGLPSWVSSQHIVAYDPAGNLKWAYYTGTAYCNAAPRVGADGNIYFFVNGHLIGLAPNLAPGETEPTKVMDISLDLSCDWEITPPISVYKDGLIVSSPMGGASNHLLYITYGGEILANVEGKLGRINAEGNSFFVGLNGSGDQYMVSKISPVTRVTDWVTAIPVPRSDADFMRGIYPTPDGGAVARIQKQRVGDDGQSEYVESLTYIDKDGQVVRTFEFSSPDAPDGSADMSVDIAGNLVYLKNRTNYIDPDNSNTTVSSIEIKMTQLKTGEAIYSSRIQGNTDESDGPLYGYRASDHMLGTGAVFIDAGVGPDMCPGCAVFDKYKLLAVKVPGLSIDYPRGTILDAAPTEPPQTFVSNAGLGDSFTAGVGAPNYDSSSKGCYRSFDSYFYSVAVQKKLKNLRFAACSGAVTDDFFKPNPDNAGEPPQLNRVDSNTENILATFSGNDAGFSEVMNACIQNPRNPNGWKCSTTKSVTAPLERRIKTLAGTAQNPERTPSGREIHPVKEVIQAIHARAPRAKIYIGGYPHLFGTNPLKYAVTSGGLVCIVGQATSGPVTASLSVSLKSVKWLNEQTDNLNKVIKTAVKNAKTSGIDATFVPATSTFDGHGLCDKKESWVNGVKLDSSNIVKPETLHPTYNGNTFGYAEAFVVKMS
jgi:hypothetical protein